MPKAPRSAATIEHKCPSGQHWRKGYSYNPKGPDKKAVVKGKCVKNPKK